MEHVIRAAALWIQEICNQSKHIKQETLFGTENVETIPSIYEYLQRCVQYMGISESVLIQALIYIQHIHQSATSIHITPLTIHRLLFMCMYLGTKYLEDKRTH